MDPIIKAWLDHYAEIPITPVRCFSGTKKPRDPGWQDMPLDQALALDWSDSNLGLAMGRGIVCLDIDCRRVDGLNADGYETIRRVEAHHGVFPVTRQHSTPSGGKHMFFRVPEKARYRNETKGFGASFWSGSGIQKSGVDVKSYGGQVVAPPSFFEGKRYLLDGVTEIAQAPKFLQDMLAVKIKPIQYGVDHAITGEPDAADTLAEIERVYNDALPCSQGSRNSEAFILACKARELNILIETAATHLELLWNSRNEPPLSWPELWQTCVNAYKHGSRGTGSSDPAVEFKARPDVIEGPANGTSYPLNMRDFDTIELRPIEWLWDQRIPAGKLTLLAGEAGVGKSTLLINLIARVSAGLPWPDGTPCAARQCIWLSGEDDPNDTVGPRLMAAGADMGMVKNLDGTPMHREPGKPPMERGFNFADDKGRLHDTLELLQKQGRSCGLIAIDPLIGFMAAKDSYKDSEMRDVLQPVAKIAARFDCAVVGVHHLNKTREGGALNRLTGAQAFGAVVRMVWLCIPDADHEDHYLFLNAKANITKRNRGGFRYSMTDMFLAEDDIELSQISRTQWGEPVTIEVNEALKKYDELIDGRKGKKNTTTKRVIRKFLEGMLEPGLRIPKDRVFARAHEEGLDYQAILEGVKAMHVQAEGEDWYLPDEFIEVRN